MKVSFLLLTAFFMILTSCAGSESEDGSGSDTGQSGNGDSNTELKFESQLYPEKSDWDHNETYSDTLEFLRYDDNYDYAFMVFKTADGKEAQIVSGVDMDNALTGSICLVEWYIDTLYEAGEGDVPYLQENLSYIEVLEATDNFEPFIRQFALDMRDENATIQPYTSDVITYGETSNPGAYCVVNYKDKVSQHLEFSREMCENVRFALPEGDFCEGYMGAKDGFYVQDYPEGKVPEFTFISEDSDFKFEEFPLPEEYRDGRIKEVTVIQDEYTLCTLYFLQLGVNWYIFVKDYCDCSA